MQRKRIYVTLTDIEQGEPGSPFHCPVARAIGRALPEAYDVGVAGNDVTWYGEERAASLRSYRPRFRALLPERVNSFIRQFDHKEHAVKAFSFTILIPGSPE